MAAKKETVTMTTTLLFSEDKSDRYLMKKVWDKSKKVATVIMLKPGAADGVTIDTTTMLVLNNLAKLSFGTANIVVRFFRRLLYSLIVFSVG